MKENQPTTSTNESNKSSKKTWLKRIGLAGFLFFLIKGLVWIAVFFGAGQLLGC